MPVGEAISGSSTSKSKQELVSITSRLHSLLTASVHAHLCARMKRKRMRHTHNNQKLRIYA